MFNRIGTFFEKAFTPGWRSNDPDFWAYYYGPVM
jgi:hypothetical protein